MRRFRSVLDSRRPTATGAAIHAFVLLAAGIAWAGQAPQPGRSALDEELLKDLNAGSVEAADRPSPTAKQDAKPDTKPNAKPDAKPEEDLKSRLSRELGEAAVPEDDDPLLSIARRMREVQGRIVKTDAGQQTQGLQSQIVADLERLIQQARKACQSPGSPSEQPQTTTARQPLEQPSSKPGGAGGNQTSPKPVGKPSERLRDNAQTRKPDMQEMRELVKRLWGELPERDRQAIQQPHVEEFLPKYESMTEEYFRSLLEEK